MKPAPFIAPLTPAYRHGAQTPWGGRALRDLFGKPLPDDRTGEALEGSTLPGLESRLPDGRTLSQAHGGPLPLLLKLIDAREALSVQVHPDDAYAAAREGGKLGKTEAWLVLSAVPGAHLVYGLLPGTDVSALTPETLEARLRFVAVEKGDVLFIPAGMVHAIGAGIVLYEIQQASDITYRFWDWGRRDPSGALRPLHWADAARVARADLRLDPVRARPEPVPGGARARCLQTPFFTLDRFTSEGSLSLPDGPGFRFLTALCEGALRWQGLVFPFGPGQTFFLEAGARGVTVEGRGDVVVSGEG